MPKRFVLLLLLLCVWGCEVSREQQLVGTWSADATKTELPVKGFEERVAPVLSLITLKLRGDGTFVFVAGQPIEGKWTLEGDEIVLHNRRGEIRAKVRSDNKGMSLGHETPFGRVDLALKKTG